MYYVYMCVYVCVCGRVVRALCVYMCVCVRGVRAVRACTVTQVVAKLCFMLLLILIAQGTVGHGGAR